MVRLGIALLLAFGSWGCARVAGSAVATGGAAAAPVDESVPIPLSALHVPEGAAQVGLVQARGVGDLPELAVEFRKQVRKVGGNYGKVDSLRTRFENFTSVETYTYSCGTPTTPATCTGTRIVTRTVATHQLLGRAFKVESP